MEVILIDSPVANVANIARALRAAGAELRVTSDPALVGPAAKIVLPGVGSFGAAMGWLTGTGIGPAIRAAAARDAAILGVCVGHQVLFETSYEMGTLAGLGLVRGEIRKLETALPVPQIGWNRLRNASGPLFEGIASQSSFYFVNSFAAVASEDAVATADYGRPFTAAIQRGRVFGVQFHPEKSSAAGLRLLRNFVELPC